jgi:hypothetical protein
MCGLLPNSGICRVCFMVFFWAVHRADITELNDLVMYLHWHKQAEQLLYYKLLTPVLTPDTCAALTLPSGKKRVVRDIFHGDYPTWSQLEGKYFSCSQLKQPVICLMNWQLESKCSESLTILCTVSSQERMGYVGWHALQSGQCQWQLIIASTGCWTSVFYHKTQRTNHHYMPIICISMQINKCSVHSLPTELLLVCSRSRLPRSVIGPVCITGA